MASIAQGTALRTWCNISTTSCKDKSKIHAIFLLVKNCYTVILSHLKRKKWFMETVICYLSRLEMMSLTPVTMSRIELVRVMPWRENVPWNGPIYTLGRGLSRLQMTMWSQIAPWSENIPPKGVSFSDLICIFAMSIVRFACFLFATLR